MKSPDKESVRVSTPPRSIVLSHHHFPSASDDPEEANSQTDTLNAEDDEDIELTSVARAIDSVRQQDNKNFFRTVDRFHRWEMNCRAVEESGLTIFYWFPAEGALPR